MNKKRKCDKNTSQYNKPSIGIYREIGQQVLVFIEDGHTHRRTYFVYVDCNVLVAIYYLK